MNTEKKKIFKELKSQIFERCAKGDYVQVSNYTILSALKTRPSGKLNEEKISKWSLEYKKFIERYPYMITPIIPSFASRFVPIPRFPVAFADSFSDSHIEAALQVLYMIKPIRDVYIHSRWEHGVPISSLKLIKEKIQEEFKSKAITKDVLDQIVSIDFAKNEYVKKLHNLISSIFTSMANISCGSKTYFADISDSRSFGGMNTAYLQRNIMTDFMSTIVDTINVHCDDFLPTLSHFFNAVLDKAIIPHNAFYKIFMDMCFSYELSTGILAKSLFLPLYLTSDIPEQWRLIDPLTTFPIVLNERNSIQKFTHVSNYLLITLSYREGSDSKRCFIPRNFKITDIDSELHLIGLVLEDVPGHFAVLAFYGIKWYLIQSSKIFPVHIETNHNDLFLDKKILLLIYKKKEKKILKSCK